MNVDSAMGVVSQNMNYAQNNPSGQEVGSQDRAVAQQSAGGQEQEAARNSEQAQQEAAQTTGVGGNLNFSA